MKNYNKNGAIKKRIPIRNLKNEYYTRLLKELENETYYWLRCLNRVGIHPTPAEIGLINLPRADKTISELVCYPIPKTYDDLPKCLRYGFKLDYNFKNLEFPIVATFTTDLLELSKWKQLNNK